MNYIVVKNSTDTNTKKSLSDIASMYANTGFVSPIELYRLQKAPYSYVVKFPNRPGFDHFSYFVNYLKFPIYIPGYNPSVFGIWKIDKLIERLDFKIGEVIGLYISEKEDEYDNVYTINPEGLTQKYSFYIKTFEVNKSNLQYEDIVTPIGEIVLDTKIYPPEGQSKTTNKPWWKFW